MKNNKSKVCMRMLAVIVILVMTFAVFMSGCSTKKTVERGDLPYYGVMNPAYSMKTPSVERIYKYAGAAVLVSFVDGPRYFVKDVELAPGSGEEAVYLKTGVKTTVGRQEYTVKIIQVLDDSGYDLKVDEDIKIRCGTTDMDYDPFSLYINQDPEQNFVIFLYKSSKAEEADCFYYTQLMQYYEKDGVVFAASQDGDIDQYSGMTIEEFANVLKKIEQVDPHSVS
jgi:hypothetical protein